jgi:hypothetical protein
VFLKRVVVAGLLWGCLFSAARPSPCVLALNSQLPLRSTTGHKLVDALIDEQPATLIFDTGAYSSLLTTQAVSRLHLHADQDFSERFRGPEDPWTVRGIGGARLATWVMAKHVQVGALSGRHFHFLTIDGKMHQGLRRRSRFSRQGDPALQNLRGLRSAESVSHTAALCRAIDPGERHVRHVTVGQSDSRWA